MLQESKELYEFGSFRLDVAERTLEHTDGLSNCALPDKAFQTLVYLVRHNGHLVSKEEILQAVWPGTIVEENNLDKSIHAIRRVLSEKPGERKYIETVLKHGYRFVADVCTVSAPVAQPRIIKSGGRAIVNLAEWRELPERIEAQKVPLVLDPNNNDAPPVTEEQQSDSGVSRTEKLFLPSGSKRYFLAGAAVVGLIVLAVIVGYFFLIRTTATVEAKRSIAVLPLKPIGAANRDEIYEVGIADSLIQRLSSMNGITVRPLNTIRQYTDLAQDPLVAGREQKVDYVLASNYQLADGRIRITAQLFNVATGKIEETYKTEKDSGNIFALQDTIAGEIGELLQTRFALTPNPSTARRGTSNVEAYRLYLQGKYLTMKRNDADAKKAVEYLEQAIRLDPNFAVAFAQMAHAYRRANFGGDGEYEKIKEFIKKALELDPNLAEAYVARANGYLINEWNFPAVENDLAKASELEPNNDAAHWLNALLLAYRGRFDEALLEIETAQAIDPGALMYQRDRGRILYYARRYDEAINQLNRVIDLDKPFGTQFSNWLISAYEMKGNYAAAYETFINFQKQKKPERVEIYQQIYAADGWQAVRRKQIEYAKLSEFKAEDNFFNMARISAQLSEKDAAFEYLNKAVENREWSIIMLNVDPPLDPLRDDPRFAELVRRIGLK